MATALFSHSVRAHSSLVRERRAFVVAFSLCMSHCRFTLIGFTRLALILDMVLYTCDVGEACFIAFLLRVFEIPGHCEDNAYVSYLRYSGIVRTMPTYLI